jgi:hypothetical protein
MTPKETAKELVDKMLTAYDIQPIAIKCALIAVDEIMKAPHQNSYIELIPEEAETTDWFWDKFDEYWNEVKQEIEQL